MRLPRPLTLLLACAGPGVSASPRTRKADTPRRPFARGAAPTDGAYTAPSSRSASAPVIVDNRPAASGVVGADLVAKASPDGHTLLVVSVTFVISAALQKGLPYQTKDFAPITLLIAAPLGLMVHPSLPAKNVKEFIAYAKANPGKLNYGSSGPGSIAHLSTELMNSMAGVRMTHVPYKGVAAYTAAQLGNEIMWA